jgi:hypothetical protein
MIVVSLFLFHFYQHIIMIHPTKYRKGHIGSYPQPTNRRGIKTKHYMLSCLAYDWELNDE